MNDGKRLEALVAFVEEQMLPDGYDVKTNQGVFNDEGVQIAEFDVEIRGKLGTTDIAWLIECRDRPSQGAAPASWIEQLVGRRARFGFNKVTAVSTTGFAPGAQEFAQKQGIELRVVDALSPDAFSWFEAGHMSFLSRRADLEQAKIGISENLLSREGLAELREVLATANGETKLLRKIATGECFTVADAFLGAVQLENLLDGIEPGEPPVQVHMQARYLNDEDHFVVDTKLGAMRVEEIIFIGKLSATETRVPMSVATRYSQVESGQTISQMAGFAPQDIAGQSMALELHRMGDDGETYVVLRKV